MSGGRALFSTLPPLRAFFGRLIEERMAPTAASGGEASASAPSVV